MITFLYDTDDNLITDLVNTAVLNPQIIKVENMLLDGTYHTQSIGERLDIINVICYVDAAGKELIDNMYIQDIPIKLVKLDKYYIGLIKDLEDWKVFVKGQLYGVGFRLTVESEGLI